MAMQYMKARVSVLLPISGLTRRATLICAALLAMAGPSFAQSTAAWIDPGWRRTIARETIRFEADGSYVDTFEVELQALTEAGVPRIAQATFEYNSYLSTIELSDLKTIKTDGRMIPVDERAINDQPQAVNPRSPYFADYRVKVVAYPNVEPGDRLAAKVVRKGIRNLVKGEFFGRWVNPLAGPPGVLDLTVDLPADGRARTLSQNSVELVEKLGDRIIHHVTLRHDRSEAQTLDIEEAGTTPTFEVSTLADYPALAEKIAALNAPMAVPDDAIRKLAGEIVGAATDRRQKAERLYNWVAQNIRYVGIGLNDGGFTSQPASAVLAARYGDCKAHVTLLKALLATQDIEADFVAVNTIARFSLPALPAPSFDHAIIYLPEFDVYADPTTGIYGFGMLPTALYGKPVLNLDQQTLGRIPPLRGDDMVLESETMMTLAPDGTRRGTSVFSGGGIGDAVRRQIGLNFESRDRRQIADAQLRNANLAGSGDYQFASPRDLATSFKITSPVQITTPIDLQKEMKLSFPVPTTIEPNLMERLVIGVAGQPFLCRSLRLREVIKLRLPETVTPQSVPNPLHRDLTLFGKTGFGVVKGRIVEHHEIVLADGTLTVEHRVDVDVDAPVCPAAFWNNFETLARQWNSARGFGITLKPARALDKVENGPPAP